MYSKERAQNIAKKDVKFIPAGIHENIVLDSARIDKSPNGNSFIEILFKNGETATLTQTEWKPSKINDMTDADVQKKEDTQFSRMMQILLCFYTDEQLVFNGSSFEEFAKEVVDYLNNADKSKLLRVKIVYNDKGYTTLPSYAKYTFIEPMILPEGKTSSIIELGIDNFTKPVVADKEAKVATLTGASATFTSNYTSTSTSDPNGLLF